MLNTDSTAIEDLTYEEYQQKLLSEISEELILKRSEKLKRAHHFSYENNAWKPLPYEGAAVVSMLNQSKKNDDLISRLNEVQHTLKEKVEPNSLYFLPEDSFHQTIANTLSADRFQKNIIEAGLESTYPNIVQQAFSEISLVNSEQEISMKMIGLSLFGTALAMVGIFENENDYEVLTHFRRSFYSNKELNEVGVQMTRPFIGHITLGYIETELNEQGRVRLADSIIVINETLKEEDNFFKIATAELRRYHHLAEFLRPENYPLFNFCIA